MNKTVIVAFLVIVGAVLIGIPVYKFLNPGIDFEKQTTQVVDASSDPSVTASIFENTRWMHSDQVNANIGNGQVIPLSVDFEIIFQQDGKLNLKAMFFPAAGQLPQSIQAFHDKGMGDGWSGSWKVISSGKYLECRMDNPFSSIRSISDIFPFTEKNLRVEGKSLIFKTSDFREVELIKSV